MLKIGCNFLIRIFPSFQLFLLLICSMTLSSQPVSGYITGCGQTELYFRNNSISTDFAALDFTNLLKNISVFGRSDSDNVSETMITLTINRPWWKQTWIYFVYLAVAGFVIYKILTHQLAQFRLKDNFRIADLESTKLRELDQLKSKFFANISHEFRTPLTLIKGPLEQLYEKEDESEKRHALTMMLSNTSRLLQLINQLLDLSKIESGNYNVKAGTGDILVFIKGITASFASLAEKNQVTLKINEGKALEILLTEFYYDPDIMEKILNNLISNSIKFTPANGTIAIGIHLRSYRDKTDFLEVCVADTGSGIPADKLPFIYDRFYQADPGSEREKDGSGIGLAFVKELVRLHKATISVRSLPNEGTTFRLCFPLGRDHFSDDQIKVLLTGLDKKTDHIIPADHPGEFITNGSDHNGAPLVLLVEDHQEVSHYIAGSLKLDYTVLETTSPLEGFGIAEEQIPDLIISDVMMPGINGYEFCNLIKSSDKTSHIPVILLTARADDSDRIMGLEMGADDYLSKPFNVRELQIRVKNLVDNRRLLREKFTSNQIIRPEEVSVSKRDAVFIEKLLRVVERNIGNHAFSVEDMGREAGMSKSQIHRKLKATVNMSANHFIRSVRMRRAMELLRQNSGNISEISFMVGYDDPGYFTKTFRSFFGKLPSEVTKNNHS